MCALNSPTDAVEPPLTGYDLAQACGDVMRALAAHLDTVIRIGVDGETRAAFRARGARPEKATVSLDCALVAYFAICRNAIGETSGTYATIADVADAMPARLDRNDRDITRTAMRRVDTAEAADKALTDRAHAVGADLASLDADHCYGKCAAPAPSPSTAHGAYERSFVSPAAA